MKNKAHFKKKSAVLTASIALVMSFSLSSSVFASHGIQDVYQMALEHDVLLAQARAKYESGQQTMDLAISTVLPQIKADGSYAKNDSSIDTSDVSTRVMSVTVNQPLFDYGMLARYRQSEQFVKQSEYAIELAKQDIIIRVSEAYFTHLLAQEDVSLALAKEKADKNQWQNAKVSAEVGLVSRTDVLQAKSSLDLSTYNRLLAENNLDVAKEKITKITGNPVTDLRSLSLAMDFPRQVLDIAQWEKEAIEGNLNVLSLARSVTIAQREIEAQQSGHWFTAGLQAKYSDTAFSGYNAGTNYNNKKDLLLSAYVSVPLYSGGKVSANVSKARADLKVANEALRGAREQASLDARIQVRNIQRGYSLVSALKEAVKSNNAFLEAAEEGHKVGLKTLLEVLSARANSYKAKRDLTESIHNLILARLKLDVSAGKLTDDKLQKIDKHLIDRPK